MNNKAALSNKLQATKTTTLSKLSNILIQRKV